MSNVVIVGSGATYGSLGAPLMRGFGSYLERSTGGEWQLLYPYMSSFVGGLAARSLIQSMTDWKLDRVWGLMDYYHKFRPALGEWPFPLELWPDGKHRWAKRPPCIGPWDLAGREVARSVALVYGDKLRPLLKSINRARVEQSGLAEALAGLQHGDLVVSFNYDILVETVLTLLGYHASKVCPTANLWERGAGLWIAKPHGSLSWRRSPSDGSNEDYLAWWDTTIPDSVVNVQWQPAIIPPVPFKSEVLEPALQKAYSPTLFRWLTAQWRWTNKALREATEIRLVGFGMSPDDGHFTQLLETAVGEQTNVSIRAWDTPEGFEKTRNRFTKLGIPSTSVSRPGQVHAMYP